MNLLNHAMYHRIGVITFMAYAFPAMLNISLAPFEVRCSLDESKKINTRVNEGVTAR
jgi:hypothetical protein